MWTLKEAKRHAKNMAKLHREPWIVFITPADAQCNRGPLSIYNTGRFLACALSERAEYEAGGAFFPKISSGEIIAHPPSNALRRAGL